MGLLPAAQDVFLDACRKPLAPDTRKCFMPVFCLATNVVAPCWYADGTEAGQCNLVGLLSSQCTTDSSVGPYAAITKGEQVLWHDQYIKSAAELCQWEAIAE